MALTKYKAMNTDEMKLQKDIKPKAIQSVGTKDRKTFLNSFDKTQVRTIKGHEIIFANLKKIYWPEGKVTKRDMLNYYYQVGPSFYLI